VIGSTTKYVEEEQSASNHHGGPSYAARATVQGSKRDACQATALQSLAQSRVRWDCACACTAVTSRVCAVQVRISLTAACGV
jgi:hypothetical protein